MLSETTGDEEEPKASEEGSDPPTAAEGTQTEAPEKDAASKFVAAGEGTVSDGKGSTKKVFFLQKKDGPRPQWLKQVSEGLTSARAAAGTALTGVGAATNDAVTRLVKKSDEKKEAENMEAEDKPTPKQAAPFKAIVDAGRESVEKASSRLSGLVAAIQPPPKENGDAADAKETESPGPPPPGGESSAEAAPGRLAAFRTLLASRKEATPQAVEDELNALKSQVDSLTAVVKSLAERLATVEKANNITPPDDPPATTTEEAS
mmetsp:Transcript_15525/g.50900  ORF Transcript_15525/g.50900 Transcript_15525/m.50900 type:complete len:262 (+) Transcript_15525:4323-5108(+)